MEDKVKEIIRYYEKHILEDIMPFWVKRNPKRYISIKLL